jgi:hypothetical protein
MSDFSEMVAAGAGASALRRIGCVVFIVAALAFAIGALVSCSVGGSGQ